MTATTAATTAAPPRRLLLAERRSLVSMAAVILALHLAGFGVLVAVVAPQHLALGGGHAVFGVGVGVLAYAFGLRHAFDADHIAAVDNTVRRLLTDRAEGGGTAARPLSVGFWFALGHSTVVVALAVALAAGVRAVAGQVLDGGSRVHVVAAVVGPAVSGTFLWVLGLANLTALVGIVRLARARSAGASGAELERLLERRGPVTRLLGSLAGAIRRPAHVYPVGLLFGLGFDTATEIGLLVLAGGAGAAGLPWYAVLVLPTLFAAGIALLDTVDGVVMSVAYEWALARPGRRVGYNLVTTGLSVAVAIGVGTVELIGAVAS
ncbi:MAG: HoxN/HupN/NixA family nickel/cobalt transporter [Promicromonosporaceae bacterium]|nr:HoxN/HupN/NixA family nickel/cobalt transporter [Promicromonosporaceae bacterium]